MAIASSPSFFGDRPRAVFERGREREERVEIFGVVFHLFLKRKKKGSSSLPRNNTNQARSGFFFSFFFSRFFNDGG